MCRFMQPTTTSHLPLNMLQRVCVSLIARRSNVLARSCGSASKSLFGIKNKSASKASNIFLINKSEVFNTKRTIVHWEDEELPGTSKDPRVIELNNRLREHFDKGNYEAIKGMISEAKISGIEGDIQTYAIQTKVVKALHEAKYKGIPLSKRVPDLSGLKKDLFADVGPQAFAYLFDQLLANQKTDKMAEAVTEMRKNKVKATVDIMKYILRGLGNEGKAILEDMVKRGEADQKTLTTALQQAQQ